MDAHLLFDLADRQGIARARRVVVVDDELGHDEQRHALDAIGAAGDLGQHQVDDVVGHVVIAGRDKDLLAGDLVRPVVLRFRLGAHQAQIRAAMRFGQVHGAGPFAGDHLGQEGLLLLVRAMGVDGGIGPVGQARVHHEGHVRGREDFPRCRRQQVGQALAAIFGIAIQAGPAAFAELVEGLLEALGRVDHAVFKADAFLVTNRVQRREDVACQLAGLFEDGAGEIAVQLVIAGHVLFGSFQHVMQDELHVLDGGGEGRHCSLPFAAGYSAAFVLRSEEIILSPHAICSFSSAIASFSSSRFCSMSERRCCATS